MTPRPPALPLVPLLLAALVLAAAGCGQLFRGGGWGESGGPEPLLDDDSAGGHDDDGDDDATTGGIPVALHCLSAQPSVSYAWMEPATVQLSAEIEFSDGGSAPATGVDWAVLDEFGGSVSGDGLYTTPWNRGGQVRIQASLDSLEDVCTLDLHLQIVVDQTGTAGLADGTPPAVASAVLADSCAPLAVYPLDDSVIPTSIAPPTFQWTVPSSAPTSVVTMEAGYVTVQLTTPSWSWMPDGNLWFAITQSAGSDEVIWRVFAGTWDTGSNSYVGGLCGSSAPPWSFRSSALGLDGSIYYWSPATQGLWKLDTGGTAAESWLTSNESGWCVGCHTVNLSNPDRMAMNYGGGDQWAVASDVASPLSPLLAPGQRPGNFMALNPDGTRLVRSFHGVLYLDDLTADAEIGTLPTAGHASHPNWSPDGSMLVYSSCASAYGGYDWVVEGCGIRTIQAQAGDVFVNDSALIGPEPGWNLYYPSFSPDSQWIAFNRSTGDAYDDVDAELLVMPVSGGTPVLLSRANGAAGQANSWPRWGPAVGDYAWIAFASRRPYGNVVAGTAQIWLAAVDLGLAQTGADGSFPAVWLPGQDPTVGNHTPVWVPRYVAPP
jgi:hypothetical protein